MYAYMYVCAEAPCTRITYGYRPHRNSENAIEKQLFENVVQRGTFCKRNFSETLSKVELSVNATFLKRSTKWNFLKRNFSEMPTEMDLSENATFRRPGLKWNFLKTQRFFFLLFSRVDCENGSLETAAGRHGDNLVPRTHVTLVQQNG